MELTEIKTIRSSEKSKIVLGEYEGKRYIKKTGEFSRETADAILSVKSPYIAGICEIGENYLITEYAEGFPLSERKIPKNDVFRVALELCDTLSALHKKDIIHRDIKPSNIIMCNDGHIKLIDFDAARLKKIGIDKDTRFIGTEGFAPPEQYGFSQTDERSDIYAFGITIKTLLGEEYKRSSYKHVIEKCIKFNPDERYQSVKTVKIMLLASKGTPYILMAIGAAVIIAGAIGAVNLQKAKLPVSYNYLNSSFSSSPSYSSSISSYTSFGSSSSSKSSSSSSTPTPSSPSSSYKSSSSSSTPKSSSSSSIPKSSSSSSIPKSSSSSSTPKSSSSSSAPTPSSSSSSSKSSRSSSMPKSSSSSSTPKSSSSSSASTPSSPSSSYKSSSSSSTPTPSSSSSSSSSSKSPQVPIVPNNEPVKTAETFPVSWDRLTLPKGFPKFTDSISSYELNSKDLSPQYKYHFVINWDKLQESEASEISQKIRNWIGYDAIYTELTDELSGKPSWSFENSEYLIILYYYSYGISHWCLDVYSYKGEENSRYPQLNLKHADPAVTPGSERTVKWEDKEVPDELPKLTDYVSEAVMYNNTYEIHWNKMNFSESEYVAKIIYEVIGDDYELSLNFDHSKYYYWEFNCSLNGVKKTISVYYIDDKYEPAIGLEPHTSVSVSYP